MQQINKIAQIFCDILEISYFGECWACQGVHDQTQQILHELKLLKLPWISSYMHEMNIIPQIVFEILTFKNSCNLIGGDHFGQQLENQIFTRHTVFIKPYSQLWDII